MKRKLSRKAALQATAAAGIVAATISWAWRDYQAWIKLGPGGLPANFKGWLQTTRWRLQQRDPFDVSDLDTRSPNPGAIARLAVLPHRSSPRPRVAPHPVPHRQLTQHAAADVLRELQHVFDAAVKANEGKVFYALSHFERHTPAVTSCLDHACDPVQGSSHGEIAHIHPQDGSMHMILSPTDAIAAIEAGWAERHGLAGKVRGLPATYLLVYSPQTRGDVAIIAGLLSAAISYMTLEAFPS